MARYALRRLAAAVPLLFLVSFLCFAVLNTAPGGPLGAVDPRLRGADLARLQERWGLDRPFHERYGRWLGALVRGDLGTSLVTGQPVAAMIGARLPATLELAGAALVLSMAFGLAVGIASALGRGTWIDAALGAATLAGISIPVFWLGVLALLVFSAQLGWLPAGGRTTLGAPYSLLDHLRHLVLPASVLASVLVPQWSRHVRASLLEVLGEDWLRAARARGFSERRLLLRHALRPALVPVVTLAALQVPALLTGAILTETIFAWPGIGRLFYDGIQRFDYPRLMGILVLASGLVVVCNLAADLVHARLDPRLRKEWAR